MNKFYVYEHWRPDTDTCFYVGKGHGSRAYNFKRKHNIRHRNIVKKLIKLGMCAEVRMVASSLTEEVAFKSEIERIAFWRSLGVNIVNKTDGGEGASGYRHTAEVKQMLRKSLALANQTRGPHSPETIAKMRAAKLGKKQSPEHISNAAAANRGRKYVRSEEYCLKMSRIKIGRRHSDETKAKMSISQSGKIKPISPETIAKISLRLKGKPWSEKRRAVQNAKEMSGG